MQTILHPTLGDNKFPYYCGNSSIRLQEQLDREEEDEEPAFKEPEEYEQLKSYIPSSVLTFLLDPNPSGNL